MKEIDTLIEKQIQILPKSVGWAISRVDLKNKVKKISSIIELTEEQNSALEAEVLLLIYSFIPQDDFLDNVFENVEVDELTAEKIFDLIEREIIIPISNEIDNFKEKLDSIEPHHKSIDLSKQLEIEAPVPEKLIEAPHEETKSIISVPRYDGGIDPYREITK